MGISPVDDKLISLIKSINEDVKIRNEENRISVGIQEDIRKELIKALSDNNYELLFLKQSGRDLDDIYSQYFCEKEGVKNEI